MGYSLAVHCVQPAGYPGSFWILNSGSVNIGNMYSICSLPSDGRRNAE